MAFASHGDTKTTIRDISSHTTIPNNPINHLRYYLNIISTLRGIDDNSPCVKSLKWRPNWKELSDFSTPKSTTFEELATIVGFCMIDSPDELIGTLFIQDDALCGDEMSKMLAVSKMERNMLVSDSASIGGLRLKVEMVMAFQPIWLVRYWIAPMKFINPEDEKLDAKLTKIRQQVPAVVALESLIQFESLPSRSSCCAIL